MAKTMKKKESVKSRATSTWQARARGASKSVPRAFTMQGEFATMRQTYPFSTLQNGIAYSDFQISLARSNRAVQIAKAYREYRIPKVEFLFKPLVDTFASDNPSLGSGVPYIYTLVDPTGSFSTFNSGVQMREAGAVPRRFDDKTVSVSFVPSVLDYVYDKNNTSNTWAKPMKAPWLATNKGNFASGAWAPSSIDHLGMVWIVEGGNSNSGYQVECVIHYEFRKPAFLSQPTSAEEPGTVEASSVTPGENYKPLVEPDPAP